MDPYQRIRELEARVDQLEKEKNELREKLKQIEALLRQYVNPHTPSSKRLHSDKPKEEPSEAPPKKRGAPEGHEGATRKTPLPNQFVEVKPEKCKCGSTKIMLLRAIRKIVEDVEIKPVVTEYTFYECKCKNCGNIFETSHELLPRKGDFGPNILSLWTMLHYHGAVPFERLSQVSEKCFAVPITPAGIQNAIYGAAEAFEPEFNATKAAMPFSNYVRSDETSYSFNGEKYWLWNFSNWDATLVLLRDSRSSSVPLEVLGEDFKGIFCTDCYPAYDCIKALAKQKCWAHILRDAKEAAETSREGRNLYAFLAKAYAYIKKVKVAGGENTPRVLRWVKRKKREIRALMRRKWRYELPRKIVKRMVRYLDDWFTCLVYGFVEATNNASERDVRKNVLARKISGLHRSQRGLHAREIMMSLLLTRSRRNQNAYDFVAQGLKKSNLNGNFN